MKCPHCESSTTIERRERTELGYRRFRCRVCHREFNERTGTRFNHLQFPTDVICLVVLWRVRYKLLSFVKRKERLFSVSKVTQKHRYRTIAAIARTGVCAWK